MTVEKIKDFIYENYYRRIGFFQEKSYSSLKHQKKQDSLLLATKLIQKYLVLLILNSTINLICREKNAKLVKRSKIITQQTKTFENRNVVDIKSVTIEHPKTFHKLSKTIRQAEKVS